MSFLPQTSMLNYISISNIMLILLEVLVHTWHLYNILEDKIILSNSFENLKNMTPFFFTLTSNLERMSYISVYCWVALKLITNLTLLNLWKHAFKIGYYINYFLSKFNSGKNSVIKIFNPSNPTHIFEVIFYKNIIINYLF